MCSKDGNAGVDFIDKKSCKTSDDTVQIYALLYIF